MDKEPEVIASFPQLIGWFDDKAEKLLDKSKEVRMLSYLFRRLSLYFGSALCFFILCLVMTFTQSVTLVMVNDWLSSVPEALRWWAGGYFWLLLASSLGTFASVTGLRPSYFPV